MKKLLLIKCLCLLFYLSGSTFASGLEVDQAAKTIQKFWRRASARRSFLEAESSIVCSPIKHALLRMYRNAVKQEAWKFMSTPAFLNPLLTIFNLHGNGWSFNNFDNVGVRAVAEFSEVNHSLAAKGFQIKFLLGSEDEDGLSEPDGNKLPNLSQGEGRVFYIQDLDMEDGITNHVSLIFVDYDRKSVYVFDSIGLMTHEIVAYAESFGEEFTLWLGLAKIQRDQVSCMNFVGEMMAIITNFPGDFFVYLQQIKNSQKIKRPRLKNLSGKVVLFDCPLPESMILSQSLSDIRTYDTWLSFIARSSSTLSLKSLKRKFKKKFIKVEALKITKETPWETRVAVEESKEILLSFCHQWLPYFHENREHLKRLLNIEARLRNRDGGVGVDSEGKESNTLMRRRRFKLLYYMTTKKSFDSKKKSRL